MTRKKGLRDWFDSWTKRSAAALGLLVVAAPIGYQGYTHFAKAWELAEIKIQLDKKDLWQVRRDIREIEALSAKRTLTSVEIKQLQDLKDLEREILRQIEQRQRGG
jgi:hypothetical protein